MYSPCIRRLISLYLTYSEYRFDVEPTNSASKNNFDLYSNIDKKFVLPQMNDHGLEQLVHFPTREKNTLDLLLTFLPGQFQDIHSPDKLSDHDIVAGTLKVVIPPIKEPQGKM